MTLLATLTGILLCVLQPTEREQLSTLLRTFRSSSPSVAEQRAALAQAQGVDSPRAVQAILEVFQILNEESSRLQKRIRSAAKSSGRRDTGLAEMRRKVRPLLAMQQDIVNMLRAMKNKDTHKFFFEEVIGNGKVHLTIRTVALVTMGTNLPDSPQSANQLVKIFTKLESMALPLEKKRRQAIHSMDKKPVAELRRDLDPIRRFQDRILTALLSLSNPETLSWLFENTIENFRIPLSLRVSLIQSNSQNNVISIPAIVKSLEDARDPGAIAILLRGIARSGKRGQEAGILVISFLSHEDETVREQAAYTLSKLALPDSIQPLLDRLEHEEGRTLHRMIQALEVITGQNHGTRIKAWKQWFSDRGQAYLNGTVPLGKGTGTGSEEVTRGYYFGIPQIGQSIVYVIDVSGSMNESMDFAGKGRRTQKAKDGETSRLDACKTELTQALRALPSNTRFNIIYYSDVARIYSKKMGKASESTLRAASKWVNQLEAGGATNIYDALDAAFALAGNGTTDKYYNPIVETVFLLTDGKPQLPNGAMDNTERIRAAVRRWNPYGKLVIHTIGMGAGVNEDFLKNLALENGGRYVPR